MVCKRLIQKTIIFLIIANFTVAEDDYEIFTKPMVSEGEVYNQVMFEMEDDHERLCGTEGRLLKEKGNYLVQCSTDSECLPPSQCNMATGFCCMMALNQEPPPVGCPMGTRSLRNSSGYELTCNPSEPNSCPGGAHCYTDSLTQEKRCCGADPGQGCPAGSRVIVNGTSDNPLLCTPGRTTCPRSGMCQWSHLIDRYQCCEPDNGCPRHQSPLKTDRGDALTCSPGGPPCPGGASCRFNFWTAEYQCCRTDTADLCPTGQVPFLHETDATPRQCKKDSECPNGFLCSDNNLCCGHPGSCPTSYTPMKDAYGRLTSCSSRQGNTCPVGSTCQQSSIVSQKLCCTQEEYKCPDSTSTPYPSPRHPQTCSLGNPWDCSEGQCMPSNINGVSICCRSRFPTKPVQANHCPAGWMLPDNIVTFCTPSAYGSTCPGFSSCLRSNVVQQQFVCCIPGLRSSSLAREDSCQRAGASAERQNGQTRVCRPGAVSQCSSGFSCQPSIRNGWLCCSTSRAQAQQSVFTCPLNGQSPVITAQGSNQFCTLPGQRGECPQNALCLAANNQPSLNICCYAQTTAVTPVCPNNAVPQPSLSGYVACSATSPICDNGYTCVQSANDYNIMMCCSSSATQTPTCPGQQTLYMELGRPRYCLPSQSTACPSGYSCQNALGTSGTYVCCSSPASATCPSQFTASLDSLGKSIYCSPSQPAGCPSGSVCLQSSSGDSLYLCCRTASSPRVCPNNQNALLTPSGSLETCTGPGSPCSRNGYSCQLSSVLAQYICCGMDQAIAVCADGRESFTQTSGQTYTCNPLSFPTGCPVGYDCAVSTVPSVHVCCLRTTGPVIPTTTIIPIFPPQPTDNIQCPVGWNPHRNAIDAQPRTCSSPTDTSCPIGFSCTPSSISGIFICCRLATSIACPRGTPYLLNSQPRLCSRNRANQCPREYSCEQSTSPTLTICCSSSLLDEAFLCPDRSSPAKINGNVRSCPTTDLDLGCPSGYVCKQSNKGMNVCCTGSISRLSAPIPSIATKGSPSYQCPNGVQAGSTSIICHDNSSCPTGSLCQPTTNSPGVSICCASRVPTDTRCFGRMTQLVNNKPVACLVGNTCVNGYVCSDMTSNQSPTCCQNEKEALAICPDNRAPFIVSRTENMMFCDETAYVCPSGQECKQAIDGSGRFVCCSQKPYCISGQPQFESGAVKRCFSSSSCANGYSCQSSTVSGLSVCCSSSNAISQNYASPSKATEDDEWVVIEG